MGIFDSLVEGEQGGMPTGILNQSGWRGALEGNNPMMNIGLGILANNQGNYGSAMAALGKGAQQGVQNTQTSRQAQMQQAIYKMKLDEAKRALEQQKKQEEFLKTYGQPNATQESTTQAPDTWQNAMQGQDAPNFNMQRVAGQTTTTQTPYFDQNKALLGAVQNGAIDFKDYVTLTQKDKSPIKASAGDIFLDPTTYKPLYSAPEKVDYNKAFLPDGSPNTAFQEYETGKKNAPSGIQEYEYAKQQGYRGSYLDFQLEQKRAGASSTSISYGSPVAGIDASGNPVFFQPSKNGGAPSIVAGVKPTPVAQKAPTEGQAKAATFHSQMTSASKELANLESEGYDPSSLSSQFGATFATGSTNPLTSGKSQRARQAQNQWAESFLRVKTGAAATKDEVTSNVETFFPKIGDTPDVIEQKSRMRAQAENDVAAMTANPNNIMSKETKIPPKKSAISSGGWSAKKVTK
jgi:hypothetical protein